MTLAEMLRIHSRLFYQQNWYDGESFMLTNYDVADATRLTAPLFAPVRSHTDRLPSAIRLAACYVMSSRDPAWRHWFWTSDFDKHGQRIYCGVGPDEKGFEIHRHIHLTERFGVAVWR